jgi:hypothetical protein
MLADLLEIKTSGVPRQEGGSADDTVEDARFRDFSTARSTRW